MEPYFKGHKHRSVVRIEGGEAANQLIDCSGQFWKDRKTCSGGCLVRGMNTEQELNLRAWDRVIALTAMTPHPRRFLA